MDIEDIYDNEENLGRKSASDFRPKPNAKTKPNPYGTNAPVESKDVLSADSSS